MDVVVVDKAGNAIRGLRADDFTLLDRKRPQQISAFEEISHDRPVSAAPARAPTVRLDVANNQSAQPDRLVVMVVDDLHIYKGRTDKARTLARLVVGELGQQASMAVIFTSGEHSTQVTTDTSQLLAAVDTLQGRKPFPRPHQAVDNQRAPAGSAEQEGNARLDALNQAMRVNLQDFEDNMTQYKTLQDAARMLGADDARRKAFVLLSEGIGKDLSGIFDAMAPPKSGIIPPYHAIALVDMMEAMRRSNVAAYAIDPRGRISSQDLMRESFPEPPGFAGSTGGRAADDDARFRWHNPVRQSQDGLSIMAQASGGFAITDTDDFATGIGRIIQDLDHYYLLGFYPPDPSGKRYRPLDVRVPGHPDWTVRFRRGYMTGAPPPPKSTDPLVALSAGVMPKRDLPLQLWATALPGTGRMAAVAVAMEVTAPTRAMTGSDGRLHDEVSYQLLVIDDRKSKVTSRAVQSARIVLSAREGQGAGPDTVTYQIPLSVELPPGRYQLRASATSARLAQGGSVYLGIEVPDFSKAPVTLSGLVLGLAGGSPVPVARVTGEAAGLPFPPSLTREFTSSDTLRVYAEVALRNPAAAVLAKLTIVDAQDRIAGSAEQRTGGRGQVDLTLLLKDLAPGAYRVQITATDGSTITQRELSIIMKAP